MLSKKGQAPLEHIVIYAWTIIGLLATIGVFAYFDLFTLEKYAGQVCDFDANFYCDNYVIRESANNTFNMTLLLQNNMNKEIFLNKTALVDRNGAPILCNGVLLYCPDDNTILFANASQSNASLSVQDYSIDWTPSRQCKIIWQDCNSVVDPGFKKEVNVELNFSRENSNYTHLSYGRVYTNVQS